MVETVALVNTRSAGVVRPSTLKQGSMLVPDLLVLLVQLKVEVQLQLQVVVEVGELRNQL